MQVLRELELAQQCAVEWQKELKELNFMILAVVPRSEGLLL